MGLLKQAQDLKQSVSDSIESFFSVLRSQVEALVPRQLRGLEFPLTESRFIPSKCIPYLYIVLRTPDAPNAPQRTSPEGSAELQKQIRILFRTKGLDRSATGSMSNDNDRKG